MKKLYWKIRKIIQPEFVAMRNKYIQRNINQCECIKQMIGEKRFNDRWGEGYIDRMKSDLV